MKTYNPESEEWILWTTKPPNRHLKNTLYTLRCRLSEAQQVPDAYAQCYVNELQQAIISLEAVIKYY